MFIDFDNRGGGGPTPSDVYTKEEVNALIADFITNTVDDLVYYYDKTETYTKSEIEALVGQITSFEVVATLPVSDIKTNVIYLLGPTGSGADRYEEWIYSNSAWVKIGETSVDLSNYITVNQLNTALGFYTTTQQLNTLLAAKQDTLTAGDGITIGTDNVISAESNVVSLTQAQYDALAEKDPDVVYIITDATPVTLATVATTGVYSDLTGTPTLATVATSGSYNDLTDKPVIPVVPTLATVATSGSYNDLTDKPSIPVVPTLATVATTGDYEDLTNKPVIPVVPTLATVATSGSYNDLSDTPAIPTVGTGTVTLTQNGATIGTFGLNDTDDKTIEIPAGGGGGNAWYGTEAEFSALGTNIDTETDYYISDEIDWTEITNRPTVPTKTSELTNDSYFTTKPYVDYAIKHPDEKAIMKIVNDHNVYLTQAEYDQLGTNVDPDTNYHIEGDEQTVTLVFTLDSIGTVAYDVYVSPAQ